MCHTPAAPFKDATERTSASHVFEARTETGKSFFREIDPGQQVAATVVDFTEFLHYISGLL